MSAAHVVELPKSVGIIKIVQLVLAVLILAFSAFDVAVIPFSTHGFAIFVSLFSIISLVYYYVAVHRNQKIYNWIAILVLECFGVIFWLSVWADLAALYTVLTIADAEYDYYYDGKRSSRLSSSRVNSSSVNSSSTGTNVYGLSSAYTGTLLASIILGVLLFVLYCVTLGFLGAGIHRHRKAGKPIKADGFTSSSSQGTWSAQGRVEKNEMNNMGASTNSNYPQNTYQPNAAPYEQKSQTQYTSTPVSGEPGYPEAQAPQPEMYGGSNRY